METMMKSGFCFCIVFLFALGHADAALTRMDDFELVAHDTPIGGVAPNSDPTGPAMVPWGTEPVDTGLIQAWLDPSGAANMALYAQGYSGSDRAVMLSRTGSAGWIADSDATEGTKGTLFLRFYVDSADPNVEAYFGLGTRTTSAADTNKNRVRVGVAVYNDPASGLGLYQMVGSSTLSSGVHSHIRVSDLATDTWYNIWIVADRTGMPTSLDLFDVYINTSAAAAPGDRVVDDVPFSNGTTGSLKGFHAVFEAGSDQIYFDDLYMDDDDEDLSNPAPVWGGAAHPSPRDEAQLDTADVTFQWKSGVDPANPSQSNPAITKHYLYVTPVNPNDVVDWTAYLTEVPAGSPANQTVSYGPVSLSPNKTYWWVVDESVNDSAPGDPGTIFGRIWSFTTVQTVPEIVGGPTSAFVFENETGEIAIDVNSISQAHYAWYRGSVGDTSQPVGTDSSTLTIENAQVAHEDTYWCRVTNSAGTTDSTAAALVIKRLMAHWTMDEADYVGGQYRDVSGNNHHADVVGTPAFVADLKGNASSSAQSSLTGGYATAGTWDPSAVSESLGVTAWIRPIVPGSSAGIVSKRESWASGEGLKWTISYHTDDTIRFVTYAGGSLYSDRTVPMNEWTHVACTYDIVADQAKVYLNGEDAGTDTSFGLDSNDVATIRIAHYDAAVSDSDIFIGDLDDIRIYNYGLSSEEVAALYYDVTGIPPCKTRIDLRFDLNDDCRVDFFDYAVFISHWLECGLYPDDACN